jgi:hypothetical protein
VRIKVQEISTNFPKRILKNSNLQIKLSLNKELVQLLKIKAFNIALMSEKKIF